MPSPQIPIRIAVITPESASQILKTRSAITIRLDSQPFKCASKIYLGEIRRCEELEGDDNSHLYGVVKYVSPGVNWETENSTFFLTDVSC